MIGTLHEEFDVSAARIVQILKEVQAGSGAGDLQPLSDRDSVGRTLEFLDARLSKSFDWTFALL
jgi:hypothetical protein